EASTKKAREHPHGQKEPRPTPDPALPIRREPAARHHAMQMRVMHEVLSPGMQDREEADLGTEMFGVRADGAQGLGGGGEEQVIDHGLVLIGDGRDLFRQRKDDVKVWAVEQLRLSIFDPCGARERLALRAVPITAAVVGNAFMLTGITAFTMP